MSDVPRSPVFYAPSDDPELTRAMERARATFKYLWRELTWEYRRIIPALDLAAIKAAFLDPGDDPGNTEHMWLSDVDFDGQTVRGTLLNQPNTVTSVKAGDSITLDRDAIEDWIYARQGRMYGGFTIQILRAAMSPAERKSHDSAWGFKFADPSRVDVVPDWNAEKQGWFARTFRPASATDVDPDAEHPMSESMADGFPSEIAKNREAFFAIGPEGLTALHSFALGGSLGCVRALLDAGADPHVRTSYGKSALDLAVMMDWPRVVDALRNAKGVA